MLRKNKERSIIIILVDGKDMSYIYAFQINFNAYMWDIPSIIYFKNQFIFIWCIRTFH